MGCARSSEEGISPGEASPMEKKAIDALSPMDHDSPSVETCKPNVIVLLNERAKSGKAQLISSIKYKRSAVMEFSIDGEDENELARNEELLRKLFTELASYTCARVVNWEHFQVIEMKTVDRLVKLKVVMNPKNLHDICKFALIWKLEFLCSRLGQIDLHVYDPIGLKNCHHVEGDVRVKGVFQLIEGEPSQGSQQLRRDLRGHISSHCLTLAANVNIQDLLFGRDRTSFTVFLTLPSLIVIRMEAACLVRQYRFREPEATAIWELSNLEEVIEIEPELTPRDMKSERRGSTGRRSSSSASARANPLNDYDPREYEKQVREKYKRDKEELKKSANARKNLELKASGYTPDVLAERRRSSTLAAERG